MAWLRGLVFFALLVAIPFLLEELFGRHPLARNIRIGDIRVGSFWPDFPSYSGFEILIFLLIVVFAALLISYLIYLPQTYQIAEWLTLAEREFNGQLRGWGGGLPPDARRNMAVERAQWLDMLKGDVLKEIGPRLYEEFYRTNLKEQGGGAQGESMGRARYTAFLLRESTRAI